MRIVQKKLLPNSTVLDLTDKVMTQTTSLFAPDGSESGWITITTILEQNESQRSSKHESEKIEESTASENRMEAEGIEFNTNLNELKLKEWKLNNNTTVTDNIRIKQDVKDNCVPCPIEIINTNVTTNIPSLPNRPESLVICPLQFVWCGNNLLKDDWAQYKFNLMAVQYIERYPLNEALMIYCAVKGFEYYRETDSLVNSVYRKIGVEPTWEEFKNEIDQRFQKTSANVYRIVSLNNKIKNKNRKVKTVEPVRCGICNNTNHNTKSCNSAMKNIWKLGKCNICNAKGHAPANCPVERIAEEVMTGIEGLKKIGDNSWWLGSDKSSNRK